MTEPRVGAHRGPHGPGPSGGSGTWAGWGSGAGPAGTRRPRHRDTWSRLWTGLLFVPVSSFLGLVMIMLNGNPDVFFGVWGANVWGSLVFVLGTVFSFYACLWLMEDRAGASGKASWGVLAGAAFFVAFVTAFVYALSWGLSVDSFFVGAGPTEIRLLWDDDVISAALVWGWPGLLGNAVFMPWAALRVLGVASSKAVAAA